MMTFSKSLFFKFFTGSLAGAILDFSVATVLIFFNVSTPAACFMGFLVAIGFTYAIHHRWTFAIHKKERFWSGRLVQYVICALFILSIRLGVIFTFQFFFATQSSYIWIAVVFFAICISFVLNFLLSKYVIFTY